MAGRGAKSAKVSRKSASVCAASQKNAPSEGVPSRRGTTKRGRSGKKWVSQNYERMEELKAANYGVMPYSDALVTTPFPHSDEWSEENLPEILFYIKPPRSPYQGQAVQPLMEEGKPVMAQNGNQLRDLPVLPRRISLDVPGWLVEAWRRTDPRINYADILDRQIEDHKLKLTKITSNAFQNHCRRECRMILGLWTSYDRRDIPHRTDVEAVEGLTYNNIKLNTILQICQDHPDRLNKVSLVKRAQDGCGKYYAEPRVFDDTNILDNTFPMDYFVLRSEISTILHSMDSSMIAAWELSLVLSERASIHGVSHWSKLPKACRPVSWFDRTNEKSRANETFDEGCEVCTWDPARDRRDHKDYILAELRTHSSSVPATETSRKRKTRSAETRSESATSSSNDDSEECPCCVEARCDGHQDQHRPSKRFRMGDFPSHYRDPDVNNVDLKRRCEEGSNEQPSSPRQTSFSNFRSPTSARSPSSHHIVMPVHANTPIDPILQNCHPSDAMPVEHSLNETVLKAIDRKEWVPDSAVNGNDLLSKLWYPPYGGVPAGYTGPMCVYEGPEAVPKREETVSPSFDDIATHEPDASQEDAEACLKSPLSSTISDLSSTPATPPNLLPELQALLSSPRCHSIPAPSARFPELLEQSILPQSNSGESMTSPEQISDDQDADQDLSSTAPSSVDESVDTSLNRNHTS